MALSVFVLYYAMQGFLSKNWISGVLSVIYIAIVIFHWYPSLIKNLRLVKQISYDDQYLYVHEEGTDTQIPLERIRDVEITSLDGMYKFNLMDKEAFGPYIMCKTSMWYPFNFKKVDKELDYVRFLISKRKRTLQTDFQQQLPSNTA